jgi:hypothetical protein
MNKNKRKYMRKMAKAKFWMALSVVFAVSTSTFAGNEDRAGSAGSTDLLINPWARSSGLGGSNSAFVKGLEAQFLNVAGLAYTTKTEILFSHSRWLAGSGIGINAFGVAQNLGKKRGVFGLSVTAMDSGPIQETTVNQPEGTGSTYNVSNLNIAISYARAFSDKISGGITIRVISQSISNVAASGFSIDAAIMYKTTLGTKRELNKDNLHFGISLKNIGPRMSATGDGLTVQYSSPIHGALISVQQRSAEFELPALMNIGIGYIYRITKKHSLDFSFNFTTNSFTRDQFMLGAEYNFNSMLMIRGGFAFEEGIFGDREGTTPALTNAFTGPSGGISFEAPFKKNGKTKIGIDYSYRATYNFLGVHSFGARLLL